MRSFESDDRGVEDDLVTAKTNHNHQGRPPRTPERIDTAPTDGGGRTVTRPAATCVGFLPARPGSRRVPHTNVRPLAGHPLPASALHPAIDSGVLQPVIVAPDPAAYEKSENPLV